MAFFDIEPFGSHYDDLRAGSIQAAIYNANRDVTKRPEPYGALHFMPWNDSHQVEREAAAAPPVLLDDPKAQADLLRATIFGVTRE